MAAYYNEFDPKAAAMLRQLIKDGLIADGVVDERSIIDVAASDLHGFQQCHFFAGIGGWSVALRLAGWPDDRPVWTGSCPCQPFSTAGAQKGHADERHLWPHWARLIRESKPATIFGEQVAGAIAFGWLDEVFNDLEAEAYSCAAALLPACSVGLPHKRDRLWFVANFGGGGWTAALWLTPACVMTVEHPDDMRARAKKNGYKNGTKVGSLASQVALWATPNTMDHLAQRSYEAMKRMATNGGRKNRSFPGNLREQVDPLMCRAYQEASEEANTSMRMDEKQKYPSMIAQTSNGLHAQMENQGQLNVEFVCWLMGYSTEHLSSMHLAMQLFQPLRRNSSKQQAG